MVSSLRAESLQLCLILCERMYCSPPGSSIHGSLQTRILEWVAISFPGDLPVQILYPLQLLPCKQILYC